jgi:hypothetical protein
MAATKSDRGSYLEQQLVSAGERSTAWFLGPGFLAFDFGAFFLIAPTLLMWNLWRDPSNVWAFNLFRYWGFFLIAHSVAIALTWGTWRFLHGDEAQDQRQPTVWSTRSGAVPPSWAVTDSEQIAATQSYGRSIAADAGQRAGENLRGVARKTKGAVSSAAGKWSTIWQSHSSQPSNQVGENWPSGFSERRQDESEFIARFGTTPVPTSDQSRPAQPFDSDDVVLGYGTSVRPNADAPANGNKPPVRGKETRWSWVEAAASSWLTRGDQPEPPAAKPATAKESVDSSSAVDPTPNEPASEQRDA